jgi:sugar phosphate isomerase/epimerase
MKRAYRRALSTLGCPALPLEGALALASDHGIDAVELRSLEGTTDLPALFGRQGLDHVRSAQKAHGAVQVLILSTSLRLVRPTDADRAQFLAFAPWANAMGVPWLRVFDGISASEPGSVSEAAETVRWWGRMRESQGWEADLLVETHDGLVTSEAIDRFCTMAEGSRILWDSHATWRATGTAPHELWPSISSHVSHIHVKDSVSRPAGRLPYTYVLPGAGEFPMAPLVSALGRDRYAGAVSLEWERQWHPDLPTLEQALEAAARLDWW